MCNLVIEHLIPLEENHPGSVKNMKTGELAHIASMVWLDEISFNSAKVVLTELCLNRDKYAPKEKITE